MSKYEAQRAMKLAKYERDLERAASRAGGSPRVNAKPAAVAPAAAKTTTAAAPSAGTATCGHKSMNGRTCTREAGHSEKSHRYS